MDASSTLAKPSRLATGTTPPFKPKDSATAACDALASDMPVDDEPVRRPNVAPVASSSAAAAENFKRRKPTARKRCSGSADTEAERTAAGDAVAVAVVVVAVSTSRVPSPRAKPAAICSQATRRGTLRPATGDVEGARADWLKVAKDAAGTPTADAAQRNLERLDLDAQ